MKKKSFNLTVLSLISLFSALFCLCIFVNRADSQSYYDDRNSPENYSTVILPQGTLLKTILQHKIGSGLNNLDDTVETMIMMDLNYNNSILIPRGSKLIGRITKISKPEVGKNATIQIVFHKLKIVDGTTYEILGRIWTPDGYSTLGGELTDRVSVRRIAHYIEGIGGIIQLVPDGPRKIGSEVEYLPGTEFVIVMDKRLKLKVSNN